MLSHIDHPQSGLGAVPMGMGVSACTLWALPIVPSTAAWGWAPTVNLPLGQVALGEAVPYPVPFLPP